MTFLYSALTEISKNGKSCKKFELEPFPSDALTGEKNKPDFIQLQTVNTEKDAFVPFEKGEDGLKGKIEAEDILRKAVKKAAYIEQEAYEKGFAQGEKDGLELGEKRAAKIAENIENILIELKRMKEEIPRKYEKEILGLIFAISKKIVHFEIASNEAAVKETISNALNFAAEKSEIILSVNPEDFEYVNKLRGQLFGEIKDLKSISINSDLSITRGGCFLETPHGDIDSTVETQLMKIYRSMEKRFDEKGEAYP